MSLLFEVMTDGFLVCWTSLVTSASSASLTEGELRIMTLFDSIEDVESLYVVSNASSINSTDDSSVVTLNIVVLLGLFNV